MNKHQLAIKTAKSVASLTRLLKLGAGTSLPGKVAEKLDPDILKHLTSQLNQVFAVTGTNGKTTTAGLLHQLLETAGQSVVHNQLGANMVSGITAALLHQSDGRGDLKADTAVLEIDEASLRRLVEYTNINTLVVTNLFRDQLDRYGELDTTARLIGEGIHGTKIVGGEGKLILNADDPMVTTLGRVDGEALSNTVYFGIDTVKYQHEWRLQTDVPFSREISQCPSCNGDIDYNTIIYGHLGHYHCNQCQYTRPKPDVLAKQVLVQPEGSDIKIQSRFGEESLFLPLPGLFNVYNFLAAYSVLASDEQFQCAQGDAQKALDSYESVFGRAEKKEINGKSVMVFLIKNPVGATEVLKLVAGVPNGKLLIALNDNYADGRDISWIWDAAFELIPKDKQITVSGKRAEDMAVRLKYAGIDPEGLTIQADLNMAVNLALENTKENETLFILPTYTNLLDLRYIL